MRPDADAPGPVPRMLEDADASPEGRAAPGQGWRGGGRPERGRGVRARAARLLKREAADTGQRRPPGRAGTGGGARPARRAGVHVTRRPIAGPDLVRWAPQISPAGEGRADEDAAGARPAGVGQAARATAGSLEAAEPDRDGRRRGAGPGGGALGPAEARERQGEDHDEDRERQRGAEAWTAEAGNGGVADATEAAPGGVPASLDDDEITALVDEGWKGGDPVDLVDPTRYPRPVQAMKLVKRLKPDKVHSERNNPTSRRRRCTTTSASAWRRAGSTCGRGSTSRSRSRRTSTSDRRGRRASRRQSSLVAEQRDGGDHEADADRLAFASLDEEDSTNAGAPARPRPASGSGSLSGAQGAGTPGRPRLRRSPPRPPGTTGSRADTSASSAAIPWRRRGSTPNEERCVTRREFARRTRRPQHELLPGDRGWALRAAPSRCRSSWVRYG